MLLDIVPHVIGADEHRKDIRLQVEHVLLPPVFQVIKRVARYPPVEELQSGIRLGALVVCGADKHVTVPVDMVEVLLVALVRGSHAAPAASPSAVSDRVTDVKYSLCVECGAGQQQDTCHDGYDESFHFFSIPFSSCQWFFFIIIAFAIAGEVTWRIPFQFG